MRSMSGLKKHKLFINGQWADASQSVTLQSSFSGEAVAEVAQVDPRQLEECIAVSQEAFETLRKASRFARSTLLRKMAAGIESRRSEFRDSIIREAGKPYAQADTEVSRAINTFTLAAEEVRRFAGEIVPVDLDAGSRSYGPAESQWFPRGPVLAIGPFNFPLNLIAHKIAPALAVGSPVIVKPAPQAPGAATLLAEVFRASLVDEIPVGSLQVINGANEVIEKAVSDSRIPVLSFTGSDVVGWKLKEKANKKKVLLELGGNAAAIVHSDADLKRAASRLATGGFAYAGQVCISVQRIFVQENVMAEFQNLFLNEVAQLKVGDPGAEDTAVGPLIDKKAADRVSLWIDEACQAGARLLVGGARKDCFISPAVLINVPVTAKLFSEEVFGPVVILSTYNNFDEALKLVNQSRFGLQAGVFTDSSRLITKAFSELAVGGVIINDGPTYRADNMPYGGVKDSGDGREGVRYAMEEYCERKVLVRFN